MSKSPTALKYPAGELSAELAERIEDVLDALGITVAHRGRGVLECWAPWSKHTKPKLLVDISAIPGKWNDWFGGFFGDAFDLVAMVEGDGVKDRKAAYAWSLKYLGLEGERPADWEARKAENHRRAEERARKAQADLAQFRRRARAQWLSARPLQEGDAGWRYLEARGIDLAQLPRPPRAVRLSAAEPWYGRGGQVEHVGPALCTAMTLPDGGFGSLHRIWINPERPGEKADISPPRKMWPDSAGAAIRLWRGGSGLSEKEAIKAGLLEPVILCEGVEDGLSLALMMPEARIIAVGSLPGLTAFVPPACTDHLVIAADNDWDKPQAVALLDRACRRFSREFGLKVKIARSPEGKDFNDLLRGET